MKALITGIICLSVLAGCASQPYNPTSNPADPTLPSTGKLGKPPAGNGICNANKVVFFIMVDSDGNAEGFACEKVKIGGKNKPTSQPDKIPQLPNSKQITEMFKYSDSTDPCYVWYANRTRYHICW